MQIKTIKTTIDKKLTEWLESISDTSLRARVKQNLLLSGGSIASMLMNEPVNDYDIYLMDMNVCKELALYYTKPFDNIIIFDGREKQKLIDATLENIDSAYSISLRNLKEDQIKLYFTDASGGISVNENKTEEELNYDPVFFSPNAISLSNDVQIVIRFWGDAEKVHRTFDFIHATNYFTFKDGLVRNLDAIESILTKQLKYQGSLYPLTSIIRVKKFIKRGFNINAGELLRIMFQVSQLDLTDPDVLEEQLIGVDIAYFEKVISALRVKQSSDPNFKLSNEYLETIINRIFN